MKLPGILPPLTPRQRGDYQTPTDLARQVWATLDATQFRLVVEPTFGLGSFLATMPAACNAAVLGWEVHQEYHQTVVEGIGADPQRFRLHCGDVLESSAADFAASIASDMLVIGNPPWVTNAEQGTLGGRNTGAKTNLKKLPGFDALTGKANFDIAEAIILHLLALTRSCRSVQFALLVKFTVARNLLLFLGHEPQIGDFEFHRIDAQRHFGASVDAGLLKFRLGANVRSHGRCAVYDLAGGEITGDIGLVGQHIIYDVQAYNRLADLDRGAANSYVWRQGVKHDLREIFELRERADEFRNHRDELVVTEPDVLYQLYKGSDIYHGRESRFAIPLYQRDLHDDLRGVAEAYPLLWRYLQSHTADFAARRSRVYQRRPLFSLFGVGDYTYRRYKVAISALHSEPVFRLLQPSPRVPTVDDTCYMLATDDEVEAVYLLAVLSLDCVRDFLLAISYRGDKRRFSKEVLSRIPIPPMADCPAALVAVAFSQWQEMGGFSADYKQALQEWFTSYRGAVLQPPLFVAD